MPAKKSRPTSDAGSSTSQKADDGSEYWELDKNRRISVREFKGKTFVDIREFYMKDGTTLPGKKGITLQPAQWRKLLELKDEITKALESH